MNRRIINICSFLSVLLFAVAPFVMSLEDTIATEMIGARSLPSMVSSLASEIRWVVLGIIAVLSVFLIANKNSKLKITSPIFLFSGFYLVQFLYAVIDGYDIQRFFLLAVLSLLVPPVIGFVVHYRPHYIKIYVYIIIFFLILSLLLNGHLIVSGQRFFGFLNNANTYGISTVFWMVILLLAEQYKLINKKLFYIVFIILILTMLSSGSRNAMVGMALIIFLYFGKTLRRLTTVVIVGMSAVAVSSYFVDLSFVSDRLLNITDSYQDSGRADIWEQAYHAIETNLWWGNGMNANQIIANTGNMHNCYIRFVLNMGLFFTIIALIFYSASIYQSFKNRKVVPTVLGCFLIVYALMNFGEDYFVGLGSATFIYLLFIFGFINYFLTKHAPSR